MSTEIPLNARQWREAHRDEYVTGVYGTGLATYAVYDEVAIMEAFARAVLAANTGEKP